MKQIKATTLLIAVLLGITCVTLPFRANVAEAAAFPQKGKHITWIVTHSPGGGYDTASRMAALSMQKYLGVNIVIKNVPGAEGRVGVNEIYRSKPDGYTIGMIAIPGMMVTQLIEATRYDLLKIKYLGRLAVENYSLSVNPKSPFHTLADMQKSKKPLRYSVSGGTGALVNILAADAFKIPSTMVSGFKGSVECIIALMAGDVDFTMTGSIVTHAKYRQSGDLRTILTLTKKRTKAMPDVPTVLELGVKVPEYLFNMQLQRVVVAPPGTPDEIVAILRKALAKVTEDKEFIAWGDKVDAGIDYASAQEMDRIVRNIASEIPKFKHIVEPLFKR